MPYDIRARLLIDEVAGSENTCELFIAAMEDEVLRRHGRVIEASADRLEFRGKWYYVRAPFYAQLPCGVTAGIVVIHREDQQFEINYSLSILPSRLVALALSGYVLYAAAKEPNAQAIVYGLATGLGFAWGFIYGVVWLRAYFEFRCMLRNVFSHSKAPEIFATKDDV